MNGVEEMRKELNQIIKDAEEHIQKVKCSNPIFQEIYAMGQRHILELEEKEQK